MHDPSIYGNKLTSPTLRDDFWQIRYYSSNASKEEFFLKIHQCVLIFLLIAIFSQME